jgi:hypothetical protein
MKKNNGKQLKSPSKKLMQTIRLQPRLESLEQWRTDFMKSAEEKVKFELSMMFSLNGIANALIDKGLITFEELEKGRIKAIEEYAAERERNLQKEKEQLEADKDKEAPTVPVQENLDSEKMVAPSVSVQEDYPVGG